MIEAAPGQKNDRRVTLERNDLSHLIPHNVSGVMDSSGRAIENRSRLHDQVNAVLIGASETKGHLISRP
jgi:indole-3-glycerol phosphate synthase